MLNPESFYEFANDMFAKKNELSSGEACEEILFRSIVNRAYYSCFHSALHLGNSSEMGHEQLVKFLLKNSKTQKIGNSLKSLKRNRHQADYDLTKTFSSNEAARSLTRAKKLLEMINKY